MSLGRCGIVPGLDRARIGGTPKAGTRATVRPIVLLARSGAAFGVPETIAEGERLRRLRARFTSDGLPQVRWLDGSYDGAPVLHTATR